MVAYISTAVLAALSVVPWLGISVASSDVLPICLPVQELLLEKLVVAGGRSVWLTNTVKICFVASHPERQPLTRADLKTNLAKFVSRPMPPASKAFLTGSSES